MIKKKKITPTESIENSGDPSVEHAFIKYPRENPVDVTETSGKHTGNRWVQISERKTNEASIGKKFEEQKRRMDIHTHPFYTDASGRFGEPMHPSGADIGIVFSSPRKTHVITYRDETTGKVGGYLVIRKLKSKDDHEELERRAKGVHEYMANLQKVGVPGVESPFNIRVKGNFRAGLQKGYDAALKRAAETIGFRYKYIPAEGYEFDMEKGGLIKKVEPSRKSKASKIEQMTIVTSIISLSLSILFLSIDITGNIIGSSNQTSSNWIGAGLFIFGLVGAIFYFRKK